MLNIQVMTWNCESGLTPAVLHLTHSAALGVLTQFYTEWAKSRYTVIICILYTYFWPTLYIHF